MKKCENKRLDNKSLNKTNQKQETPEEKAIPKEDKENSQDKEI